MKKKTITLALLSLLTLVGCEGGTDSATDAPSTEEKPAETVTEKQPRTFDDMYDDLKKPMTVTGTAKEILVNKTGGEDSVLNNTIKVLFGEKSFHIEQTGDSESITSSVYTDDTGKALHYYINEHNEVEYEVIKDKITKEEILFKEYDNPFKYVDASLFLDMGNNIYVADLDNAEKKADYNFLANNLTYIDFQSLSEKYDETFEDITLKVEDEKITGIHILSKDFTDTLGTTRFEWDLSFDYSDSTDHNYPLPSPLETKDYHNTLRAALNNLMDPNKPYTINVETDWGDNDTYHDVAYFDNDIIYIYTKDYDELTLGLIQKEDGVHKLVKRGSGYYYDSAIYSESSDESAKLSDYYPTMGIAVEWFEYDSEKNTYTLNSSSAGIFGYYMLVTSLADPQVKASDSVEITLSEDNTHVEKMVFGTSVPITATFEYGKKPESLNFDPKTIKKAGTFSGFGGTYTAKISDTETWTIVVDEDKETVAVNGTAATNIGANKYGELEFSYNGEVYSINGNATKLYKGYKSYALTRVTDAE